MDATSFQRHETEGMETRCHTNAYCAGSRRRSPEENAPETHSPANAGGFCARADISGTFGRGKLAALRTERSACGSERHSPPPLWRGLSSLWRGLLTTPPDP